MGSFDPNDAVVTEASAPPVLNHLPSNKSRDLELVVATELERNQCWHINLNAWRGPLTPAQYLQREVLLEQQPLVNNNKITFWILTYRNGQHTNTDGSRPIFAACETLLKQAYVAQNGELRRVLAHGIASVFCRSDYRGKGYASRMMDELALKLGRDAWQQLKNTNRGHFSVLFSGTSSYSRFHLVLSGPDLWALKLSEADEVTSLRDEVANLYSCCRYRPAILHEAWLESYAKHSPRAVWD